MEDVYFCKDISSQSILRLYKRIASENAGKTGIKLHFGEKGNRYFLPAELTRDLVTYTNSTFLETNVLYLGKRRYTKSHIELAKEHGFDFAPIHILDDDGELTEKRTGYKHFDEVRIPADINDYERIIIYSHFKGHMMAGFGGAIKNVGMGLASIPGKMAQHASAIPGVNDQKCINCGKCVANCPGNAITLDPVVISEEKCIGCGKCIGACPQRVFSIPWSSTSNRMFQERLVEYASMIARDRNFLYINVIDQVSALCDCDSSAPAPFVNKIGVLASKDMLAIDKASLDLVNQATGESDSFLKYSKTSGRRQIEYGTERCLGSIDYKLIDIDKK